MGRIRDAIETFTYAAFEPIRGWLFRTIEGALETFKASIIYKCRWHCIEDEFKPEPVRPMTGTSIMGGKEQQPERGKGESGRTRHS